MTGHGYLTVVDKVWGTEYWVFNNELYCMKILVIRPRGCSSLHYHPRKDESWIVEHGVLHMELDGIRSELVEGQTVRIHPGKKHKFFNVNRVENVVIREVSTYHDDADVVRLEESKMI